MDECNSCAQAEGCGIRRMVRYLEDSRDNAVNLITRTTAAVALGELGPVCEGYIQAKETQDGN